MAQRGGAWVPLRVVVIGALASILAGGAAVAVFPQMKRPSYTGRTEPFLLAVISSQEGGSLWVTVTTARPMELRSDRDIDLQITVASDIGADALLVFGGSAAKSVRACEGVGAFIDPRDDPLHSDDLNEMTQYFLTRYLQKRPGTSKITDFYYDDSTSEASAMSELSTMEFRTDAVSFDETSTRTWSYKDEPAKEYVLKGATLTCSFDRRSMLTNIGTLDEFEAPDIVAGVAELDAAGPIHIDYDFQVSNNAGSTISYQTFETSKEFISDGTRERIRDFSGGYWLRSITGEEAILNSGGLATFEQPDAPTRRSLARLAVAFFASLSIGIGIVTGGRALGLVKVLR